MTGDNCAICGERTRYDGHEIAHSCAGGVPASNLPERDHGLVSISEMNRRIAEAVAAERNACAVIADGHSDCTGFEHDGQRDGCADDIAAKIRERGAKA